MIASRLRSVPTRPVRRHEITEGCIGADEAPLLVLPLSLSSPLALDQHPRRQSKPPILAASYEHLAASFSADAHPLSQILPAVSKVRADTMRRRSPLRPGADCR